MSTLLENAKAFFSAIRDGLLTILLILFLTAPAWINARLIAAGFVEGNVAGFTWKKDIEDNSSKLKAAQTNIDTLRDQLDKTQTALKESETARLQLASQVKESAPADSPAAQTAQDMPASVAKPLASENARVLRLSRDSARILAERIEDNNNLIAQTAMRPLLKQ